jgi:hypothetical protein
MHSACWIIFWRISLFDGMVITRSVNATFIGFFHPRTFFSRSLGLELGSEIVMGNRRAGKPAVKTYPSTNLGFGLAYVTSWQKA